MTKRQKELKKLSEDIQRISYALKEATTDLSLLTYKIVNDLPMTYTPRKKAKK